MSDLKGVLSDTLAFAKRHGLDAVALLEEIAAAGSPPPQPEPEPTPEPEPVSAEQETAALLKIEAEKRLRIVKDYWQHMSQKIQGFDATAPELYQACGFDFPYRSHAISSWLSLSPEANAMPTGFDRNGRAVYTRNTKSFAERYGKRWNGVVPNGAAAASL